MDSGLINKKRILLLLLTDFSLLLVLMLQLFLRDAEMDSGQQVAVGNSAIQAEKPQKTDDIKDYAEEKKVALTFDDGPHPVYTEELLDGLLERKVQVTFFVTGEHAGLHPDLIERMQKEGHLIGNHTYTHIQLRRNNRSVFREELIKTNETIREITGEEVVYVRPPYGSWDKSFEKELNMFPVLWSVDPLDWCSRNTDCIVQKVLTNTKENDIILLHDYYETSVEAALQVVDRLTEQGYTFVTVDRILFD